MKRGEVYWADLVPRSGSEQRGRRPVIVISHDAFNQTQGWRSIIVVPLSTSAAQAGRGPSAVMFPEGTAGLGKDSVALCHQVTTMDRSKLTQRIGELNSREVKQVEDGPKAAMDLRQGCSFEDQLNQGSLKVRKGACPRHRFLILSFR